MDEADSPYFAETTVAGSVAPMAGELEEEYGPAATAAIQQGKSPSQVAYADTQDKNNMAKGLKIQQQVVKGEDPTLTAAGNAARATGITVEDEIDEGQWGQAKQDPMNYNAAITGSYYESEDPLARLKTLALSK